MTLIVSEAYSNPALGNIQYISSNMAGRLTDNGISSSEYGHSLNDCVEFITYFADIHRWPGRFHGIKFYHEVIGDA